MTAENYLFFIDQNPIENDLVLYFKKFNISIKQAHNLQTIKTLSHPPAAILIHWTFLKEKPEVLDQIGQDFSIPLIVIEDKINEEACVKALESGADDFLIKPIHPRELHARIAAINKRVTRAQSERDDDKYVLKFANWRLYPSSRQVFDHQHNELHLSAGEYELLYAFLQQPQEVLSREFLLQVVKHKQSTPSHRLIDIQISRLRQKLNTDENQSNLIRTVRNHGYALTTRVLKLKENELD